MKKLLSVSVLFFLVLPSIAQTTISGVINIYTPVVSIGCNGITVLNTSGFAVGDRALIIQMKGAAIDSSNTTSFGTVLNYADCGNFEFATIASISGSNVFFQYVLLRTYTPASGKVQLIRVPQYTNVTVSSTLTCAPWNGSTGGVLVMEVSGSLTLNANIDVSGNGFRGGSNCTNPDGGCGAGYSGFYYPVNSGFGAEKGEGITEISTVKNGGRGALANGGGGGNKHNSGGGGGGNYSAGGVGGEEANFCPPSPVGGIGGYFLNYSLNKLFLGGGGGCSDNNNGVGTTGSNGGGIIIVRANSITGNSHSIISNGIDVGVIPNGIGDGAGGGGAGGTVLLSVASYSGNLNVKANGGKGGDQNTNYGSCFGPGGGGGTGLIYASLPALPASVITTTQAGNSGIDLYIASPCYNTSYGAAAGQTATGVKYNLVLPEGNSIGANVNLDLGADTLICSGSILLDAQNPGAIHHWSTGDTSQTIVASTPGTYWATVTSVSCAITVSDTIHISGPATLVLNLGSDTSLCGAPLVLNAYNPGATYVWSTHETTSGIAVNDPDTYWVTVMSAVCALTASDTINIAGSATAGEIRVPNVITPNGDHENDFIALGSETGPELNWTIYNRWGVKIFSQSGHKVVWTGYDETTLLDEGTYFWILKYTPDCGPDEPKILKGFITLLR